MGEFFWRLKNSDRLSDHSKRHEKACADIFVGLKSTKKDFLWISKSDQKLGFRFDRAFKIFDRHFFVELQTGKDFYRREEIIPTKIANYLKLKGWFHVLFVVMNLDETVTAERYGKEILRLLKQFEEEERKTHTKFRLGTRFLVVPHTALTLDPLGTWLIHPDNEVYSFETLPLGFHSASSREEEEILTI